MSLTPEQQPYHSNRFSIKSPMICHDMTAKLLHLIPKTASIIVVVFIGTDRSSGDSLGPLTGTLLKEKRPMNLHIYGTLENPVHSKNLESTLLSIQTTYDNPFIIGVDACLGRTSSVGTIVIGEGPIKPGAALNKNLPETGHIHIAGIVNTGGMMEFLVLQSTRLHLVLQMARKLSETLKRVDRHLVKQNEKTLSLK
jgi:putative sporulation protein YyaC